MDKRAYVYVNGQRTLMLPADITADELQSLCTTKKKVVVAVERSLLDDGSIRWDLTAKPRTEAVQKSKGLLSFFGVARRKSKTKRVVWKTQLTKK